MNTSDKNIVITGATGLIGQALYSKLRKAGYSVTVLSRNPSNAARMFPDAEQCLLWAPGVSGEWQQAIDGAFGVIHLAGESLFASRWTKKFKKKILESRVRGTTDIADAILESNTAPKVLISSSAVGYYGDTGDAVVDESTPPGEDFLASVCVQWEAAAERARTEHTRVVPMRTGLIFSGKGGLLDQLVPLFKFGLGGWLGNGKQWFPWVHLDDVTGAIMHVLESSAINSACNAASPNPVTNKKFSKALGRVLHRPVVFPIPGWILRLVLGEFADAILSGQRIEPACLTSSGYVFAFPELTSALQDVT